ncbi:membrane lipoprotein lipid attachment site-containing protein [Cohnella sp.]|uniref:membrane lipoprotein lipid attachment site-containing protein n=1 Tax=Cohnella sp. TaxID=1883426 RepID=UPI00356B3B35
MKRYIFLIAAMFALTACSNDKQAEPLPEPSATIASAEPEESASPSAVTKETAESSEPPYDWSTVEVTEERARRALEGNVGAAYAITVKDETFRKIAMTYDTKGAYLEITVNPGMFADEKDFVRHAGGSLIAYSKILFSNPEVYEISVNVLIDNVGGGENDGVYISWQRDQAKDIDYDAVLDNMFGDYTIPYQLARKYSIQTELFEGLADFGLLQYKETSA